MPFINCTPHPLTIIRKDGSKLELAKGTQIPRLGMKESKVDEVEGIEIFYTEFFATTDLPTPIDDVYFIVSRMIADANPDRWDLLAPATLIRDSQGNIIGSKGLSN